MEAVLLRWMECRCAETGNFLCGFMLTRVGRAWLCCGLIGHPAERPAFSCLTLNFSGKLSLFFVCVCVCVCLK